MAMVELQTSPVCPMCLGLVPAPRPLYLMSALMPGTAEGTRGPSAGETPRGVPLTGHIHIHIHIQSLSIFMCRVQ